MAEHNITGEWGEQVAREYLAAHGYAIMDSNIHVGHKEIDIVAFKGTTIAFVEVKTRRRTDYDPADAVDARKISRLCRAADSFIRSRNILHEPRFDVIAITGIPENYTVEHYPDAFLPPLSNR